MPAQVSRMMKNNNILNWLLPFLLILISFVIVWRNHVPGTWLTGWDTLHPEFDFKLNFWRIINGVWREDQGLGTIAAHSHMSELPRLLALWLLSLVLPLSMVRYVFVMFCFVLGPLGIYVWVRQLFLKDKQQHSIAALGGFLAGLFYIFNLGTVQHFYVVFEMFAVAYAFLPWLFYLAYQYWNSGDRKWLLWFGLIGLASSSMAYASTLWLASVGGLGVFFACLMLGERTKVVGKRLGLIICTLILVNTYWLLPNLYYVNSGASKSVLDAKINQLFSPESFLQNKAYGDPVNIALLKNFLFNWQVLDHETGEFVVLLKVWQQHSERWQVLGLLLASTVGVGLVASFLKKAKWRWAVMLVMLVSISVLATDNSPFGTIFSWLREQIPFLKEALRTPFTKFSLLLMICFSIYFSFGFVAIVSLGKNKLLKKGMGLITAIILGIGLIWWGYPIFQGGLISPKIQIAIPQNYFNLFAFMKQQPAQTRVALLPVQSLFGWDYYQWGYQGAGFSWFGLPQSLLVRDFDRWSQGNEGFYNEMSTAMYSCPSFAEASEGMPSDQIPEGLFNCSLDVGRVLQKYDVTYVLLDESIVAPGRGKEILRHEETKAVMEILGWERVFSEGIAISDKGLGASENQDGSNIPMLEVWKRNESWSMSHESRVGEGFVFAPESYSYVDADPPSHKASEGHGTNKVRRDVAYEVVGTYVSTEAQNSKLKTQNENDNQRDPIASPSARLQDDVVFPFADVYREELEQVSVHTSGFGESRVTFDRTLKPGTADTLVLPALSPGSVIPVMVTALRDETHLTLRLSPGFTLTTGSHEVSLASLGEITYELSEPDAALLLQVGEAVWEIDDQSTQQRLTQLKVGEPVSIRIYSSISTPIELPVTIAPEQVTQCWTREGQEGQVSVDQKENFSTLQVADASGCISYSLGSIEENSLLRVSVAHRSADGARPHFCVDKVGEPYACEHATVFANESSSRDWTTVERFVQVAQDSEYYLDLAARPPDQVGQAWSIDYQSPRVQQHQLLVESLLEQQIWYPWLSEQNVSIPAQTDKLTATFKVLPITLSQLFGSGATNCDVFDRGEMQASRTAQGMKYQAKDRGAVCDVASNETIVLDQAYVLHLEGENTSGRSLKFYLSNWVSDRADIEYLLDEGVFNQTFGVLAWPYLKGSGYSLNLETRSFGSELAENTIQRANMYPVPLGWLARVRMVEDPSSAESLTSSLRAQDDTLDLESVSNVLNEVQIKNVKKWGTSHYLVEVEGNGLVALSQGYEDGWLGYQLKADGCSSFAKASEDKQMPDARCQIKVFMPWWFGEKLEHIKVNGWGNGFILDDRLQMKDEGSEESSDESQIVIVYWPQYLEWLGLGVLLVTFGFLGFPFGRLRARKVVKDR